MKKLRKGVFETNSSSMHSVVISGNSDDFDDFPKLDKDGMVHIRCDEFGWYYEGNYYGVERKLSYLATMIATQAYQYYDCHYEEDNLPEELNRENMEWNEDFVLVDNILVEYCKCGGWAINRIDGANYPWGYIDHQSYYPSIREFLEYECNGIPVENFLFSGGVELVIDNDNH